jgi:4-amino-4-deoxy-L-arabinose transferase-like glycosyltransferase
VTALSSAAVSRVLWLRTQTVEPVAEAAFFHRHAADLAAGLGFRSPVTGEPTTFLPPAYPLLLAGPYRVFGASPEVAGYVNLLLALITVTAVYFVAQRLFGPLTASAAALLLAVFPALVLYTNAVHADHLLIACVALLALAALVPPTERTWQRAVVAGVIIGVASLTKPSMLTLLLGAGLAWRLGSPWRQSLRLAGIAAITTLIVVTPWVVRNYVALGTPTLATNGGVNLWIGHNPDATGGWMPWRDGAWQYPANEPAKDARYRAEALRYALSNPRDTLGRALWKLDHTFNQSFAYLEHFSIQDPDRPMIGRLDLKAARAWNEWLWRFTLIGAVLALPELVRRRHRALGLVALWLALVLPVVAFFGMDRFHLPMLPIIAVLGSAVLVRAGAGTDVFREKRRYS